MAQVNSFPCDCLDCPLLRAMLCRHGQMTVIRFTLSYSPGGGIDVQRLSHTDQGDATWERGESSGKSDATFSRKTTLVHPSIAR